MADSMTTLAKGPCVVFGEEKVRENRLRRVAERQGLRLVKSRRRDTRALDYGLYVLLAASGAPPAIESLATAAFSAGKGMTLDQIEAQLLGN